MIKTYFFIRESDHSDNNQSLNESQFYIHCIFNSQCLQLHHKSFLTRINNEYRPLFVASTLHVLAMPAKIIITFRNFLLIFYEITFYLMCTSSPLIFQSAFHIYETILPQAASQTNQVPLSCKRSNCIPFEIVLNERFG